MNFLSWDNIISFLKRNNFFFDSAYFSSSFTLFFLLLNYIIFLCFCQLSSTVRCLFSVVALQHCCALSCVGLFDEVFQLLLRLSQLGEDPRFFPAEQNRKLLDEERVRNIMNGTPMRRYGDPNELVGAAILLLSKNAGSYITGSPVYVDGGFTASWF